MANARIIAAAVTSYDRHCGPNAVAAAEADLLGQALAACRAVVERYRTAGPLGSNQWEKFDHCVRECQIVLDKTDGHPTELEAVTAMAWRAMSEQERTACHEGWKRQGVVSFMCLTCGYPLAQGQATCESCRPDQT